MKKEDWVFNLERQIVNNVKTQITNLDVANILEFNRTGEIKEISYVPIIENNLYYLWKKVEDNVNNSFFSNAFELAEFNDSDKKKIEGMIRYWEEEIANETDKKQKAIKQAELKKLKTKLATLKSEVKISKKEIKVIDDLEAIKLEKQLKNKELSSEERKAALEKLAVYKTKLRRDIEEEDYVLTDQDKKDVKNIKEKKEKERLQRKEGYSKEVLENIEKVENLSTKVKSKAFKTKFSESEFMKRRYSDLSNLLNKNLADKEKEEKKIRFQKILKVVNAEAKYNQYSLKENIEKIITTDENKIKKKKKEIVFRLTGGIREEAFKKQIEKLVDSGNNFKISQLEKIYVNQLRNKDLTKKQITKINKLIAELINDKENAEYYTNLISSLGKQQDKAKSVERIIITEMTAAYNIATFLSSPDVKYFKWSIEPEHERRNAVCLVCYERANGGYLNKGIYPKKQIEINQELIIPKHPYCLCRYIPITEETDPKLFAQLESMSPEQRQGYEDSMDNWVNLSNNWSKLGVIAKGAALTAVGVAALWFAAKRFKKLRETIEKATKGKIKLRQDVPVQERSPQQVINQITDEGGVLPERPQYGKGEIGKVTQRNVEAVIAATNEGRRLLLEGTNERIEDRFEKTLEMLTDEELELVEVEDIVANLKTETQKAIAPLDLELEGKIQPEYQNYPFDEFYDVEAIDDLVETRLPYELPVLTDLAEQVVQQFRRKHWQEIDDIQGFIRFFEGVNLDELENLGEADELINQIITVQKKIRELLRNLPKEVLSSKTKNKEMTFILNGKDIGFPFKGKDGEGKAIGFVQEIMKGEDSQIIRDNIITFLTEYETDLKDLLKTVENKKLDLMSKEGVYNLRGEKVFYDPLSKTLSSELDGVINKLEKEILGTDFVKDLDIITTQGEIESFEQLFRADLRRILGRVRKEDLPEEIQIKLNKVENKIKEKVDFIRNNPLLKPTDLEFNELMDIVFQKEGLTKLGQKVKNDDELFLLEFLDELSFTNNYVKIVEDLDLRGNSPEQIKDFIVTQTRGDVNIKNKLTFIDKNKNRVLSYIEKERLEVETNIRKLTNLLNSEQILIRDNQNITEKNVRREIVEVLDRLRIRQAFLAEERKRIWDYIELKRSLDNNPTSYMNTQRRLEMIPTINKNLEPLSKKFRTTQEKVNYLKKQIGVLVLEKQKVTDDKVVKEIEEKIRVLTEEIRKVQVAEFRRYEIETKNNYIQYLSVKDNVLFSRIFQKKLLKM